MIKIAIVEDEKDYSDRLKQFILTYGQDKQEEFVINQYYDGMDFLEAQAKNLFDIVFMDIVLPSYDGLEISRRFREKNSKAVLIFVTNMAQYAINGYEVNALDFLVKPVLYTNFCLKMNKALKSLNSKRDIKLSLKTLTGIVMVYLSEICYVECMGHYLYYHVYRSERNEEETVKVRGTIGEAQNSMSSPVMARVRNGNNYN